jgi:hypothetical protein
MKLQGNEIEKCSLTSSSSQSSSLATIKHKTTALLMLLVIVLGSATAEAFLFMGISSAKKYQEDQFIRSSQNLLNKIQHAWKDYVNAAAWIHGRFRNRKFDRVEFHEMYEYLVSSGLDFQAVQFAPNLTHNERAEAEAEARVFYEENYPSVDYQGFIGFNFENSTATEPRLNASFYFPVRKYRSVFFTLDNKSFFDTNSITLLHVRLHRTSNWQ